MDNIQRLEQQADVLFENLAQWEAETLRRIGKRVGDVGKMTPEETKKFDTEKAAKEDEKKTAKSLAVALAISLAMVAPIFNELLSAQHEDKRDLFEYRGIDFYEFTENKKYLGLAREHAKSTMAEILDLSKSKMWCIRDSKGRFVKMHKGYTDILNKAISEVTSGTTDFHSAMRQSIVELGGGGLRVDYGGGVTRRLDTVVRSNMLWGAKQASIAYNEQIGEELGCDGEEVDYHANPRPSHEFMQGMQYIHGEARELNGVYFDSFESPPRNNDRSAQEALRDYGCLHFIRPIVCGVSEPRFSKEELARLKEQDAKEYTIGNRTQNGYGWSQDMRRLETEVRKQKDIKAIAEASGDKELVKQCNERIKACQNKYNEISEITGIAKDTKRMSVPKTKNVLTSGASRDIMSQADIQIGKSLGAASFRDDVLLPNGKRGKIAEGSKITKVVTFAGKGTGKAVKVANQLSSSKEFRDLNISPAEWKKSRGDGYVVCDDGVTRHAELHWFESEATGRIKMKVKRYFKDET